MSNVWNNSHAVCYKLSCKLSQCLVMVNIGNWAALCRLAGSRTYCGKCLKAAHVTMIVTSSVQRTHPSPSQLALTVRCVNRVFCTLTCEQHNMIITPIQLYLFTTYSKADDTKSGRFVIDNELKRNSIQ